MHLFSFKVNCLFSCEHNLILLQIMVTSQLDIEERYKILTEERDELRRVLNDS